MYDYLFINGNIIDRVDHFKYLGTVFSHDLKWHANSEVLYNKIRMRFYAFSKFKDFRPTSGQKEYFIQTLLVPILMYNIELWFYSCTKGERQKLCRPFTRNHYCLDILNRVNSSITKTAFNFIKCDNHILNSCYLVPRTLYLMPRTRTERFLNSIIPESIQILNDGIKLELPFTYCDLSMTIFTNKSYLILSISSSVPGPL